MAADSFAGLDPLAERLRAAVRDIADFPKPGINFKDITPVVSDPVLFRDVIRALASRVGDVDAIVGIESRGFIFGAPLAVETGVGFVPFRKPGKLPYRTERIQYGLEYGTDALEAHVDGIRPGQHVLLVDDVLATGGTAAATAALLEKAGGVVVGLSFLMELTFLDGRAKLADRAIETLLSY